MLGTSGREGKLQWEHELSKSLIRSMAMLCLKRVESENQCIKTSLNIKSSLPSTNNWNNEKRGATTSTVNYHRSTTTKTSARTSDINSEDRGARLHHKNWKNVGFRVFYQQFKLLPVLMRRNAIVHGYLLFMATKGDSL